MGGEENRGKKGEKGRDEKGNIERARVGRIRDGKSLPPQILTGFTLLSTEPN